MSPQYLSDEKIIEMYFSKDENAIRFTEIKYGDYLFKIAYNILHDRADSEECKNDTYLGIWNAIPPSHPTRFPAFITKIMRNIAIGRYRKNISLKRIPSELTVSIDELYDGVKSDDTISEKCNTRELGQSISTFIHSLPEKERYIFMSRYYFYDSVREIAHRGHITESSVYKTLGKLREKLKSHLESEGFYI